MKRIAITKGEARGCLTVIREVYSTGKRKILCECSCGSTTRVRLDHFRDGHTTSCGGCGLEMGGVRKTLAAWASEHGIPESTLRYRLKSMGLREALNSRKVR
jgi:hypothetical protein